MIFGKLICCKNINNLIKCDTCINYTMTSINYCLLNNMILLYAVNFLMRYFIKLMLLYLIFNDECLIISYEVEDGPLAFPLDNV
jgi:hypothetical protein